LVILHWAARILSILLREENVNALLGDLCEEYEIRSSNEPQHTGRIRCRGEIYRSLAAALRLRVVEVLYSAPWGVAMGAYLLVGVSQVVLTLLLSPVWPEVAQTTNAWGIVIVIPAVVSIAFVAAKLNRMAPFFLAAMMFAVAALLIAVTTETVSTAYAFAFLILGPFSAALGGSLSDRRQIR
jgi:hypothetical protein